MLAVDTVPLGEVVDGEVRLHAFWARVTTIAGGLIRALSQVSICAVMSLAVARQTREIGVRVALGASPWRIVRAVVRLPGHGPDAAYVKPATSMATTIAPAPTRPGREPSRSPAVTTGCALATPLQG